MFVVVAKQGYVCKTVLDRDVVCSLKLDPRVPGLQLLQDSDAVPRKVFFGQL